MEGFGIKNIFETDTYKQQELTGLMKEALAVNGFSVVIARHPCMLLFTRKQRRANGYVDRHVQVNQSTCSHSYACVQDFACPSFIRAKDGSITVNPELCIGDGSCMQTCPSQAIVR